MKSLNNCKETSLLLFLVVGGVFLYFIWTLYLYCLCFYSSFSININEIQSFDIKTFIHCFANKLSSNLLWEERVNARLKNWRYVNGVQVSSIKVQLWKENETRVVKRLFLLLFFRRNVGNDHFLHHIKESNMREFWIC